MRGPFAPSGKQTWQFRPVLATFPEQPRRTRERALRCAACFRRNRCKESESLRGKCKDSPEPRERCAPTRSKGSGRACFRCPSRRPALAGQAGVSVASDADLLQHRHAPDDAVAACFRRLHTFLACSPLLWQGWTGQFRRLADPVSYRLVQPLCCYPSTAIRHHLRGLDLRHHSWRLPFGTRLDNQHRPVLWFCKVLRGNHSDQLTIRCLRSALDAPDHSVFYRAVPRPAVQQGRRLSASDGAGQGPVRLRAPDPFRDVRFSFGRTVLRCDAEAGRDIPPRGANRRASVGDMLIALERPASVDGDPGADHPLGLRHHENHGSLEDTHLEHRHSLRGA